MKNNIVWFNDLNNEKNKIINSWISNRFFNHLIIYECYMPDGSTELLYNYSNEYNQALNDCLVDLNIIIPDTSYTIVKERLLKENTKNVWTYKRKLEDNKMENNIVWFDESEIIDRIKEYLEYYNDFEDMINFDEIHNDIANSDYYIIDYYDAEKALYEYGYQNALDKIIDCLDVILCVSDFNDIVSICNLLWYALAQEFIQEKLFNFEDKLSVEELQKRINKIERGAL